MTGLAQGAMGLAVALGFALLCTRRTGGMATLGAGQAAAVAIAALAERHAGVAAVELVEAAALGWLGAGLLPIPSALDATLRTNAASQIRSATWREPASEASAGHWQLLAGAGLAALALTVPATGLALAVMLPGLLLLATRKLPSHQAYGVVTLQNGLVLAGLAAGLAGRRLGLVVLPILPALAFGALWLGSERGRIAILLAPRRAAWIDVALCSVVLLVAASLPWQLGEHGVSWRVDALAVHVALLLTALALAASWARRHAQPVWGSRLAILAGTMLATLSCTPLLTWLGMALATAGAVADALPTRAEAWRRLGLGCTGLGLALFGTVALLGGTLHGALYAAALGGGPLPGGDSAPVAAAACVMLGYAALAVLAPELTVAATALILRIRGVAGGDLLLALGLAALLVAALGLHAGLPQRRMLTLAGLAQGGIAVLAFGLGTVDGNLAGLLQLSFLALTQCALLLARQDGLPQVAALAGLAGLPPFGLFPSLALILTATAGHLPWLLLPLGAGLAAVAWAVLPQLRPPERPTGRQAGGRLASAGWLSPAWVPLALLLLAGFAMPDPLLAWFRLAAR